MQKLALFTILFCVTIACDYSDKREDQIQEITKMDTPFVKTIYPETDSIPENVLKFYIQFSEPMREGDFLKHIRLIDGNGNNLNGVFFDNVYELWTSNHKQLTLLVDPGRVKKGLNENLKRGRAFKAREKYKLIIDTTWKSIKGKHLKQPYIKEFVAINEDIVPPNIENIVISSIQSNTRNPITIQFNEEMDILQQHEYIKILDGEKPIYGKLITSMNGKKIQFTPRTSWKNTSYRLQIDIRLEDIVANNFSGVFDKPVSQLNQHTKEKYVYKVISIQE